MKGIFQIYIIKLADRLYINQPLIITILIPQELYLILHQTYFPKIDAMNEYRNWAQKLPAFHFDKEWDVKIIPPFQGAIIRFYISYNGKFISVYFDAYS